MHCMIDLQLYPTAALLRLYDTTVTSFMGGQAIGLLRPMYYMDVKHSNLDKSNMRTQVQIDTQ